MSKIYLQGGFGNVLFQLVHYLSLRNNGHNPVFVDTLTKKNLITRLLGWKIHDKIYLDIFSRFGSYRPETIFFKNSRHNDFGQT